MALASTALLLKFTSRAAPISPIGLETFLKRFWPFNSTTVLITLRPYQSIRRLVWSLKSKHAWMRFESRDETYLFVLFTDWFNPLVKFWNKFTLYQLFDYLVTCKSCYINDHLFLQSPRFYLQVHISCSSIGLQVSALHAAWVSPNATWSKSKVLNWQQCSSWSPSCCAALRESDSLHSPFCSPWKLYLSPLH